MRGGGMGRSRATAIGFTAVLMWALLAVLTIGSSPVPPLQLNALCFALGGGLATVWIWSRGGLGVLRQVRWTAYALGTAGLFAYHLVYFTAFRLAPAPETGLIAYLWPLLIVLFSGLLPGERLRPLHLAGAGLAFGGAALIVLQGGGSGAAPEGLALAFLCALIWSGYSVLSRRFGQVPTEAVAVYCLATAALSGLAHLAAEPTVWPSDMTGWLAVLALGLGPVGAAFFTWDIGMKRGDIQLLGTLSYAAPLLSTLVLIATGHGQATARLGLAAGMIVGGAALAALAGRGVSAPSTGG
jgi:drug/metabolite transporter (DMT)-like permease